MYNEYSVGWSDKFNMVDINIIEFINVEYFCLFLEKCEDGSVFVIMIFFFLIGFINVGDLLVRSSCDGLFNLVWKIVMNKFLICCIMVMLCYGICLL